MFKLGERVKLVSFDGELTPVSTLRKTDNYSLLIGGSGLVVDTAPPTGISADRVLITFDINLNILGLENHNETPNSLWILRSDLLAIVE
jgi:hypothetical protein